MLLLTSFGDFYKYVLFVVLLVLTSRGDYLDLRKTDEYFVLLWLLLSSLAFRNQLPSPYLERKACSSGYNRMQTATACNIARDDKEG